MSFISPPRKGFSGFEIKKSVRCRLVAAHDERQRDSGLWSIRRENQPDGSRNFRKRSGTNLARESVLESVSCQTSHRLQTVNLIFKACCKPRRSRRAKTGPRCKRQGPEVRVVLVLTDKKFDSALVCLGGPRTLNLENKNTGNGVC